MWYQYGMCCVLCTLCAPTNWDWCPLFDRPSSSQPTFFLSVNSFWFGLIVVQVKRTNHQCKRCDIQFELKHKWSFYILLLLFWNRILVWCSMQYAAFQLIEPFTIPCIHVMVWWYFPYVCRVYRMLRIWFKIRCEFILRLLNVSEFNSFFILFVILSENSFICGIFG